MAAGVGFDMTVPEFTNELLLLCQSGRIPCGGPIATRACPLEPRIPFALMWSETGYDSHDHPHLHRPTVF
jgi:hypothetical protein